MRPHARHAAVAALVALATLGPAASARPLRPQTGPYQVEILVDGQHAPTYHHRGETWVLGRKGERYEIRVANHSDRRVEVVVSVDGRDVIDGTTADYRSKRGYLVPARDSLIIDGWRISHQQAAAFRFSSVDRSYAALTGDARDVGVIGVTVFPERAPIALRPRSIPGERSAGPRPSVEEGKDTARAPSAEAEAGDIASAPTHRPGLGTGFGEAVSSPIREVEFVRADAGRPAALLGLRYDDARGLRAMGIDVDHRLEDEAARRRTADPFPGERGFAEPPPGWDADGNPR